MQHFGHRLNRASFSEILLGAYLRWSGKRHLIPLLKSLKHAGRPADVAFPAELVEQGLSLVLAGLNNTLAMQSNSSWIWPYWVERQIDPASEAFLPTGTNVIKSNLTARNWTSLGVDGSDREAMIDPVGMVTLRPYGWSWFPYLRMDDASFFPPRLTGTRQELLEGVLPVVITRYAARPDLEWFSECIALRDGDGIPDTIATGFSAEPEGVGGGGRARRDEPEWLSCTHVIRNLSARAVTVTFGVSLRPYNPLMFSPIGALRHERAPRGEGSMFRVNGKPALLLPQAPHRVTLSNRWQGDSLRAGRSGDAARLDSDSGVISASAEYHWTLEPGETRRLASLGVIARRAFSAQAAFPLPWKRTGGPASTARVPTPEELAVRRDDEVARLRAAGERGLRIDIPHEELLRAFRAVKNRLHVFDDGDRFTPGSFLYHGHWFRDAAFIALAFDQMGFGARVAGKMEAGLRRQDRRGFFRSQNGEWDSNGQALWTMVGHVQRGGDPGLLARAWPALRRGARWIDRMRRKTRGRGAAPGAEGARAPHHGLMPAGFSAEHFGPNDHYYWDNLWSLAGLEKLAWAARLLGRAREEARLRALIADFRADVDASMDAAFRRAGGEGLPCSPYRDMDSAAVGNLVGLSPLAVVRPGAEWVPGTVEHLARNYLRDGLFLQKIIHTGLNPYLSAQLARALLVRQDPRAYTVLEGLLRHGGPTRAWPEAIHPRTGGGCMGDGDHGWAAAEFLNLIRDFLVREEDGALLLCSGVPAGWFAAGSPLSVDDAPTLHGAVSFRVFRETRDQADEHAPAVLVEWSLRRRPHQDAAPLVLCLPLALGRSLAIPAPLTEACGPHLRVRLLDDDGDRNALTQSGRLRFAAHPRPPKTGDSAHVPFTERVSHVP